MEVRQRYAIRLPDELYDEVLAATKSHETVREFVADATRFWLSIRSAPPEKRHSLAAEHELFVTTFLRFLKYADRDRVAAVSHIIESWRKQQLRA